MWAYLALALSAATIALTVHSWRQTKRLSAPLPRVRCADCAAYRNVETYSFISNWDNQPLGIGRCLKWSVPFEQGGGVWSDGSDTPHGIKGNKCVAFEPRTAADPTIDPSFVDEEAWSATVRHRATKLRPRANHDFDFDESLRRNIARFPKTLARLAEDD